MQSGGGLRGRGAWAMGIGEPWGGGTISLREWSQELVSHVGQEWRECVCVGVSISQGGWALGAT